MSSHFRLLSAFLTKIFAHFGHLGICLWSSISTPLSRNVERCQCGWMHRCPLPKPHILGMGRVPIIRSRRAHKMTVMTLEDHSSKSWSHHRCHARRIRRKYPPTAFPFPPPAASPPLTPLSLSPPSSPSPLCLSCGQLGSSCTHEVSPLLRLYHSPY
jgi:hypothetical protein